MPVSEKIKNVAANPAVKKAAAALLLAVLAALGISLSSGCASLGNVDAQRARVDKFKCRVAALAPLTDPVLDTEQLVQDLYAGKANLAAVLANLNAKPGEVKALLERLSKCEAQPSPEELQSALDAGVNG